ncbi:MAG: protein kinase [Planctomycetes bacterium]|nr:protein kinase [Planctomycetota bacterium]
MNPPDPATAAAEDAFTAWLERLEAGEDVPFESMCASHPALAPTLRAAHARWQAMTRAFAALSQDERSSSLTGDEERQVREWKQRLAAARDPAVRYALGDELARGAMGRIVRAHDHELDRVVALKICRAEPGDLRQEQRFLAEARIAGKLDHPGIVPIHELGIDGAGRPYFAMRLVDGQDLARIFALARNQVDGWTRTRALSVLLRVCEAMAFAHSRSVVHRDLKPGNVMVGRFGETYVMDWGLARLLDDATPPTDTTAGEVVGTPAYMAPEQARGDGAAVDRRADVYAVGAMLYELLSGRMPYLGENEAPTPDQVLARVIAGPPAALPTRRDLADELIAICDCAMARDPGARYPDMAALAEDLRAFLEVRVVRAHAGGPWAELRKWVQRNRGLAASLVAAVVLLLIGLFASTHLWRVAERNRELASSTAVELQQELERSEFERARMALRSDDALHAEGLLWRQFVAGSHPRATHWALQELYARNPCIAAEPARVRNGEAVAFARQHGGVLVGGQDGLLRTLDALDLRPRAELAHAGPPVLALTVQDASGVAAVATADGALTFWELSPPRIRHRGAAPTGPVHALDSAADGFLGGGDDGRVHWWTAAELPPRLLHRHEHGIKSVRIDAGGRWLASGDSEGGIALHDRRDGTVRRLVGARNQVMGLSFSPDGRQLWSGGADHRLRVWDTDTGAGVATLPSQNATCRDLLHLDANTVLSGGWWRIDAWRTDSRERRPLLFTGVWTMAHDAAADRLVAANSSGLRLFDLSHRDRIEVPGTGAVIAQSGDGKRVAVFDAQRRLRVRSLPDGAVLRDFGTLARHPQSLRLDHDGQRLLLARSEPGDRMRVFDVDRGDALLVTEPVPEPPFRASYAIRPDGREVAVVRADNTVQRLDVDSGRVIDEWPVDTREILRLVYSGDGTVLATCGRAMATVILCALASGERRTLPLPARPASIALAHDGSLVAAGSWDGEVTVLDVETATPRNRVQVGNDTVWNLTFSPRDRDLLIVAGGAGSVTFLDLECNRPCLTLAAGNAAPGLTLGLGADGATLTMNGEQGAVLFDLTYFERHLAGNLEPQLARVAAQQPVPPQRLAELRQQAAAILARPWPRLARW